MLIATLVLGACYSVRYTANKRPGGPERSRTNHFFLVGLLGHSRIDLGTPCPHGITSAEVTHTSVDRLVGSLTVGFWTPTTTRYRCAAPASQASDSPRPSAWGVITARQVRVSCWDGGMKEAWLDEDGRVYADEEIRTMETVSGVTTSAF